MEEKKAKRVEAENARIASYQARHRELYNQRISGQISDAEFQAKISTTLEHTQADFDGDQWLMDHDPTPQEEEELEEKVKQARRANETMDVAEIDHPWHAYLP